MSETSSHYLGDEGEVYHDVYKDIFGPRADFSVKALQDHLAADSSFLDWGCADGSLLAVLPIERKAGVEVNPASREVAEARGLQIFGSLSDVPDESVDLVHSSHVLEHTLQPLDELKGLLRTLRPGGKLVLILPIDDWRVQRRWILPEHNHHLYTWTPQLLANLLSEAGFGVETLSVVTYTLPGRFTVRLHKSLPSWMFDMVARATSVIRRRRQLVAVAVSPSE